MEKMLKILEAQNELLRNLISGVKSHGEEMIIESLPMLLASNIKLIRAIGAKEIEELMSIEPTLSELQGEKLDNEFAEALEDTEMDTRDIVEEFNTYQ